ncbi:MAG: PspC domain-containing protein [Chloroflexota bacterium]
MRERLYRSRDDRMLFGVAGGMAEWMDLDPAIVRLVWALLILAGGVGLLLYIVAAIVIPEAPYMVGAVPGSPGSPGSPGNPAGSGAGIAGDAATPQSRWEAREARRAARRDGGGRGTGMIFGAVLVIAGVWFLVDRYVNIDTGWFMPGVLIVIGIALLLGAMGRSRDPGKG